MIQPYPVVFTGPEGTLPGLIVVRIFVRGFVVRWWQDFVAALFQFLIQESTESPPDFPSLVRTAFPFHVIVKVVDRW